MKEDNSYPPMTDESLMPFGKHKGKKLGNVDAGYLLWLYNDGLKAGTLRDYIEDNLEALRNENS